MINIWEYKSHKVWDIQQQIKELTRQDKIYKPLSYISEWKHQQIAKREQELEKLKAQTNEVTIRRIAC